MDALVPQVIASIAVIIGISYLAGAAMRRLGQPAVIGQILAGILLGPSLLGQLPGNVEAVLIPPPVVPYLTVVAQIALVLFLLAVGYELDLGVLRRQRRAVPIVSSAALVLPMLLGAGSVFAFGSWYLPGHDGPAPAGFVLYIAIAMSITAVQVLASIIAERGMTRRRPVGAFGCAADRRRVARGEPLTARGGGPVRRLPADHDLRGAAVAAPLV